MPRPRQLTCAGRAGPETVAHRKPASHRFNPEGEKAMRRLTVMALAAMLCLLLSGVAWAQRLDVSLRVTVMDHSQAAIEDAKVTAVNEATGVAITTTASSAGTY